MSETKDFLKKVGEVANEALELAESKGLTLAETMQVPQIMENIIKNELQSKGTPYTRKL